MLVAGLLTASALVTFVEAGSWSLAVRSVHRNGRKNNHTLGPLSDIYGREIKFDNLYHRVTVHLGTPPVPFEVVSGSSILWVPKNICQENVRAVKCPSTVRLYNPADSVTAEATGDPFVITYARVDKIEGWYYNDFFTLGDNMRFKKPIRFGVADDSSNKVKGIMGLPSSEAPQYRGVSIMHEAWRQGMLDAPVFTLYMRHCPPSEDCNEDGFITFGAEDKVNCGAIEGEVNVDRYKIHWEFSVSRFRMGGVDVMTPHKAIIDSGAPIIYVPTNIYDKILKKLDAKLVSGYNIVKCDVDASITVTISRREYVIPSKYMLYNLHNGDCQLMLDNSDKYMRKMMLGVPFYKAYCHIHDIKNLKISFAKIRE